MANAATLIEDQPNPTKRSADPNDDYLIALAESTEADYLVSGDPHLLNVFDVSIPIVNPREFLERLVADRAPDDSQ